MVTKVKVSISAPPLHFASLFRGLYGRIARQLDIHPSYVSRVARGERQSESIEVALEREMNKIIALAKTNHNGTNHNRAEKKPAANRKNKQVLQ